jgi:hypothetical protein
MRVARLATLVLIVEAMSIATFLVPAHAEAHER